MWNKLFIILLFSANILYTQNEQTIDQHIAIGDSFYSISQFNEALKSYEKALEISRINSDKLRTAIIISNIGNVYEDYSDYQKALSYYQNAHKLYIELGDKSGISASLNQIGNIHYRWSDLEKALEYYEQGLAIRKELNENYGIPSSMNNIGNIYYSWKKYDKALEYYLQALDIIEQHTDSTEHSSYLINIGSAYLSLQQYDQAKSYYQRALKLAKSTDNKHMMANCLINIGVLYFEQKDYLKAITYYNDANFIVDGLESKLGQAYVMRNLGETYLVLGEFQKAKEYLFKSQTIAENENLNALLAEIFLFLYEIEKEKNNYEKALQYHVKYMTLNDSIFNEESNKKLNELYSRYEYEKKENEIKEKNLELAEKQKQIQKQRLWFTLTALSIILISLFIYFYLRNKVIKKRNELEKQLNEQMQKALSAQMNPHFISNALNSIQKFFLKNDFEKANEYLADFGALVRIILENSRKIKIPLIDEIKSIELYMTLESLRLDNKFSYKINVDQAIDENNAYIPSLIIQPYVENAIWHGIAPLDTSGEINICFKKIQTDLLLCEITDSGIGINESEKRKTMYKKKHKSLGIKISKERLDLLNKTHNTNYELSITDINDTDSTKSGTKVELYISI